MVCTASETSPAPVAACLPILFTKGIAWSTPEKEHAPQLMWSTVPKNETTMFAAPDAGDTRYHISALIGGESLNSII